MARLHEFQGKALLAERGLKIPSGQAVQSSIAAKEAAQQIGGPVVLKVQAWVTGRKALGGVLFADTPDEAASHAEQLLTLQFGNFPVEDILVEECLDIAHELFVSLTIDDALRKLGEFLDVAETHLAHQRYLADDHFTLADIQFGHCLYRYFDIDIDRADRPNLRRYYETLADRPAYREHVMISYEELRVTD